MKKERGITLVALVITVIVLIILAGVTLSTLVGDNGIITKAQEAKQNMANAAAEEDKLIQNLLNEIKGIEAGEGEIEVPDPPTEPEEPTYPTIESTLSEGKYVWYTDANGTQQKCIVLYGPENSNYDSYGVQVITTDTVENVTLGSSNFNTNRDIYNSLVTTLNKEAEKYRKKDDGIAELARCVGSKPDNPNYDGAGMYTRSDSWFSSYNNTFKNKDNNYIADWNQMKNVVVNGKGIHNIGKYYWLVSRSVIADSSSSTFLVRHVDSSGELHGDNLYNGSLCLVPSNGNPGVNRYAYGLRPIFHLKSGIKVIGGDGSEGNPYTLAP